MVERGVIEKVIVPNKQKKATSASVKCFRLIETTSDDLTNEDVISAEDLVDATELGNVIHIRSLQNTC